MILGNARAGERGFTLLEVIVALAVLAVSVTVVMQIFSGGLKNIHRIDLAHRAMSHGENVMSEIISDVEIEGPTSLVGDLDEEFSYSVEVDDWEPPAGRVDIDLEEPPIRMLQVLVRIHFKNDRFGKEYHLSTLKAISTTDPLTGGDTSDSLRQLFEQQTRQP